MSPFYRCFYEHVIVQITAERGIFMSIFKMFFVVIVAYIGWGWSISFRHHGVAGVFAHPFEFFGLHNAVITDDRNIVDGSHGYANVIDIGFQLTFAAIATALISVPMQSG